MLDGFSRGPSWIRMVKEEGEKESGKWTCLFLGADEEGPGKLWWG